MKSDIIKSEIPAWKNPYPKDDPRSLLLEYQANFWLDAARFKFGLWARQTGKDFTGEGEAVEDCHKRKKTQWMVAGPSERQSLESLDKAKEWSEAFKLKIDDYVERRESIHPESLIKSAEITFHNGSRIRAVPGKPDTVRGTSANILLTEFDFFEDPQATWRAILPSITNPLRGGQKRVIILTTPNGVGSAGNKIWTKKDGKTKWSRHKVTIEDAVRMGLPIDIAELKEIFDDPDGWAQEYMCEWLDGVAYLLPYDLLALAESADGTESWSGLFNARHANPVFCGIDFGRQNDPTVCWTLEQIGDVLWTREVLVLNKISSPDQEQILRNRIAASRRSCFDYTGPGIGLGDYLVKTHQEWKPEQHKFGKVELCTFTANFKRELFPRLRRKFEAPVKLRIPISRVIREDLHEMKQVIINGQYNYWSPRTREGHSDRCTALALAIRAAGKSSGPFAFQSVSNPRSAMGGSFRRSRKGILI
jgi:phage FluMu gp28-like protein